MALRRSISASSSGTRIAKIVEIGFGRDSSDGNASFLLTLKFCYPGPFVREPWTVPSGEPTLTLWQSSDNSRIEDLRKASIIN